jgi:hypothetical protein
MMPVMGYLAVHIESIVHTMEYARTIANHGAFIGCFLERNIPPLIYARFEGTYAAQGTLPASLNMVAHSSTDSRSTLKSRIQVVHLYDLLYISAGISISISGYPSISPRKIQIK